MGVEEQSWSKYTLLNYGGLQGDGTSVKVDKFVPVGLLWSHIEKAFYPFLSPGMEKPCDLGWISDPRRRSHEENTKLNISPRETAFVFNVEAKTHTLNNVIPPGRYHQKQLSLPRIQSQQPSYSRSS